MPVGHSLDHNAIHALLYQKVDRRGRIRLYQTDLAVEIGVTKFTMSRTISKMIAAKRIRRISQKGNNQGFFVVEDPEVWSAAYGHDDGDDM